MTTAPTNSTDDSSVRSLSAVACSTALLTLLPVSAHQLGYLRHLPDPPGKAFASDRITESQAAHPFGFPDGLLGLGSYSVTLGLVLNASRSPRLRKALAFKLLLDGVLASFNMVRQVISFRRLCSWCTGTALCTVVMLISERATIRRQIAIMREKI